MRFATSVARVALTRRVGIYPGAPGRARRRRGRLRHATSGAYKDIVFWQDKACTNVFKMEGGQGGAAGVIYTPKALVSLSGSGPLGSIQVVSDAVDISGTGDMSVNFVPYLKIPLSAGIRLVG